MSRAVRKTDRGRPGRPPGFTFRHIKKRILRVRRAERLALRPPCSVRLGPAWRGKALETDGAGTQKLRLLHPVASASRWYTWLYRMFDIVWPMRRRVPIVPGADHANRLAYRDAQIIILARRQTKNCAEIRAWSIIALLHVQSDP